MRAEIKAGETITMQESHLIEYLKFIQDRYAPEGVNCKIKLEAGNATVEYLANYEIQPVQDSPETLKRVKW